MTVRAGYFGLTHTDAVAASSTAYQVPTAPDSARYAFLVTSDVDIHLHRTDGNADAAVDADATDMFVPAKTPFLVCCFAGDWLSWIENSADGFIWITRVDH